ncbi:hypothetical protein HYC85_017165 [Camellia sinensis]|uniref:Expansin-like EG45 domain-containing protein n=1 Tax=Camellia sinensis TaxID=4442 RepID=A0A7J7H2Z3_CAMSI|nr:hypothetical protein HYC85_017165 [Camellia sinensis]
MIAVASDAIGGKAACGRNYKVTCTGSTNQGVPRLCTGKSVVVTIADYCPPGCRGTIDLSQDAFAIIADHNAGKIWKGHVDINMEIAQAFQGNFVCFYELCCNHVMHPYQWNK